MSKTNYFFVLLLTILLCAPLYSDEFKLINGNVIKGELIGENDQSVTVKVKYGIIKIYKSELRPETVKTPVRKAKPLKVLKPIKLKKLKTRKIPKDHLKSMYRWLVKQTNPDTGLLESFRPTSDMRLEYQGSTYDQAVAGLAYLLLGDQDKAGAILDFYKSKWQGKGFSNFYLTTTGSTGIESTVHLGPNIWIALLALHYDRITGKNKYRSLAEDIVKWAMKLPHYH